MTSVAALLVGRNDSLKTQASISIERVEPRPVAQPAAQPVVETTQAPVDPVQPQHPYAASASTPQIVQLNGVTILHQRVPLLDMGYNADRYYLVPGAHFPGLQGLRLDDATRLVMTSFPTLTVRAIQVGEPIAYQFRRDRLTLIYDGFTKRVVSARIG
ncbi:MAG: hypothetical protein ACO35C_04900 [Pontimonas sp.]